MTRILVLATAALMACQPPPSEPSKRVLELYMHENGLSRCVEQEGERWKADASCCPDGFELAGCSVPAAIEYPKGEDGYKRTLYRHVVCTEM